MQILTRQTAINAYRYVRYNTQGYTKPFVLRKQRIEEIMQRYQTPSPYLQIVQHMLQSPESKDVKKEDGEREKEVAVTS